jgi:hypothetical protein
MTWVADRAMKCIRLTKGSYVRATKLHKKHRVFILHTISSSLQYANAIFLRETKYFTIIHIFCMSQQNHQSPSTRVKLLWVVQLESMPGYKYPNIDSGATPMGSAGRAPDRKSISRERIRQEGKKKTIGAYDRLQVPDHSLGGYSHRERWSRTQWRFTSRNEERGIKFRVHELDIHSHRESGFKNPKISGSRRTKVKN